MNTRKFILALGAVTLLAGCSSSSGLTRAEAEEKLDAIYTTATGTSFEKPATILSTTTTNSSTTTSTVILNADPTNSKLYYKIDGTTSSSGVSVKSNYEIFIWKDTSGTDAVYYIAKNDTVNGTKEYITSTLASDYVSTVYASLFSTVSTYSHKIANFLRNFDDLELYDSQSSSIADEDVTGTTKFWDIYTYHPQITEEKYTSNGDGHLYLEGNYRYSYTGEDGYTDEKEQMEWSNYLCTLVNNEKSGVKNEYDNSGAAVDFTTPDLTAYTEDTGVAEAAFLVTVLAALGVSV